MSDQYATAPVVIKPMNKDDAWLHDQLDRIHPHRHEMGSAGDTPVLVSLVFELKSKIEHLEQQLAGEKPNMSTNYARTAAWLAACGKHPSLDNASVQIGCHLEEICEFLSTLRTSSDGYAKLIERTREDLEWFAGKLKRGEQVAYVPVHLRIDALDALCDAEVTGNGIAFLMGMDKPAADLAVLASNEAKLVDGKPVILPGGKIGKPEGWQAPDLSKFV